MGAQRRMLTEADREEISRGIAEGEHGKVIAARIGRCPSIVSRDIARHGGRAGYRAVAARRVATGAPPHMCCATSSATSGTAGEHADSTTILLLVRHHDASGVSGTGTVAEGVEWTDGSASLRWRGEHAATTFWQSGIQAVLAVHGHQGATEVRYMDGLPAPGDQTAADFEYPLSTGMPVSTASQAGLCQRCGGSWPCLRYEA